LIKTGDVSYTHALSRQNYPAAGGGGFGRAGTRVLVCDESGSRTSGYGDVCDAGMSAVPCRALYPSPDRSECVSPRVSVTIKTLPSDASPRVVLCDWPGSVATSVSE